MFSDWMIPGWLNVTSCLFVVGTCLDLTYTENGRREGKVYMLSNMMSF